MSNRITVSPSEIKRYVQVQRNHDIPDEITKKLYSNLAVPSYVHGYSLAIQYFTNWFESKFEPGYLKSVYVDGKHVLDEYKKFSLNVVKGQNPRARIEPRVEYDFDRELVDWYGAPPNVYIRRSHYNQSFLKDYDRAVFLSLTARALKMTFNCKIRVNTRAMQQDLYNRMEMNFRIGATHLEMMNADFHIPKTIMLDIARKAGFEIANDNVIDVISFLAYLNKHSDIPFLFKIRAINQKPEYFIRMKGLPVHINTVEKLQIDDGEKDGKLDTNFHVEMNATMTIPIPHFYVYYSQEELADLVKVKDWEKDMVAVYSYNMEDIPRVDKNGWIQAAITEYMIDKGDTEMDLSSIFQGDNPLTRAIKHDLTQGLSPSHFINIVLYREEDKAQWENKFTIDWNTKIVKFMYPEGQDDIIRIVMYYDREYLNNLDIEMRKYNDTRIKGGAVSDALIQKDKELHPEKR